MLFRYCKGMTVSCKQFGTAHKQVKESACQIDFEILTRTCYYRAIAKVQGKLLFKSFSGTPQSR